MNLLYFLSNTKYSKFDLKPFYQIYMDEVCWRNISVNFEEDFINLYIVSDYENKIYKHIPNGILLKLSDIIELKRERK